MRGYHSLSPRARTNLTYAEPVYDGYLSLRVHGKDDEILWSYFADPRRISFHGLKRDLVDEAGDEFTKSCALDASPPPSPTPAAQDLPATLRGAGATFPYPLYQDWFSVFHRRHPAWNVEYVPTGSDEGISRLVAQTVDFAGSDIAPGTLTNRIPPSSRSFPTVGGAVVLIYNLPGFAGDLRLTPDLIAQLFSGAIRRWNDNRLISANPSVSLPEQPITIFHRADGSGTTYAFSDFLSKTDNTWKTRIGVGARLSWNVGTGVEGNDAVAQSVASTPYSIGYVEFIYAFNHHLSFASVRNVAGRFVKADLLSIMAAANGAGASDQYLSVSISNSSAVDAYPISTFSWLVMPGGLDAPKRRALLTFLQWMLTSGQRQCSALGYAPLPRNLVDRELSVLADMK